MAPSLTLLPSMEEMRSSSSSGSRRRGEEGAGGVGSGVNRRSFSAVIKASQPLPGSVNDSDGVEQRHSSQPLLWRRTTRDASGTGPQRDSEAPRPPLSESGDSGASDGSGVDDGCSAEEGRDADGGFLHKPLLPFSHGEASLGGGSGFGRRQRDSGSDDSNGGLDLVPGSWGEEAAANVPLPTSSPHPVPPAGSPPPTAVATGAGAAHVTPPFKVGTGVSRRATTAPSVTSAAALEREFLSYLASDGSP